jgi:hypothetical protein
VKDFPPTKYDTPLIEQGLSPLACYFQLWKSHNQQVLDAVPNDRLLIVRTENIIEMIPKMAEWLGIRADTLKSDRGWIFAAPKKHRTLAKLDPAYVRETANTYCGPLMQQYFPDTTFSAAVNH